MTGTVADAVGQALAALGAGHVFGVVGSGNFAVTNALRRPRVPFMAARHEGGAATMADAYARMSGRVGVVSAAPGLRADQRGDRDRRGRQVPHPADRADRRRRRLRGRSNFRIDQDALARSVGAVPERVHSPASAVADTVRAYRTAVNERRTVVLNLPTDVQSQAGAPHGSPRTTSGPCRPCPSGRPRRRRGLVGAIRAADRPVFVAGRGARRAGPRLAELADRDRRAAGDLRRRERAVRRQPVRPGDLRGVLLPAGRRADRAAPTWSSAGAAP